MSDLPNICMRCNEPITPGQETEMVPWVPRWGWSMEVHADCEFKVVPLIVWSDDPTGRYEA